MDKGENVLGIFMDLTKAFERVCHKLLLKILSQMNIKGSALKWFQSYLTNRQQYVEIQTLENNTLFKTQSKLRKIHNGVPQGSILGPILFICYISQFSKSILNVPQHNLCLYADDANVKISAESQTKLLDIVRTIMSNIKKYLNDQKLELNLKKTKFIHFRTKQSRRKFDQNISFEQSVLEPVEVTKFLGLLVDGNLTWDAHIDYIQNKINSGLYALRKMSYYCSQTSLKMIYFAFIHSHISYGVSLYGATSKTNLDKLLILQKKSNRNHSKLKTKSISKKTL